MDSKKKIITFKEAFEVLGLTGNKRNSEQMMTEGLKDIMEARSDDNMLTDSLCGMFNKCSERFLKETSEYDMMESDSESVKNPFTDSENDISFHGDNTDGDEDYVPSSSESDSDNEKIDDAEQLCTVQSTALRSTGVVEDFNPLTDENIVYPFLNSHQSLSVTRSESPERFDVTQGNESLSLKQSEGINVNKWDKQHSCLFCHRSVIKMSSHLQKVHSEEPEVLRILLLRKGSQERRKQWGILLNEGDFQHNVHVLKTGSGKIIPKYQSKKRDESHCIPCPHCKAMYGRKLLSIHVKNCTQNQGTHSKRGQAVRHGRLLMPVPNNMSEGFYRNVLDKMKKDDISRLIYNDSLLLTFGERSFHCRDLEEHTYGHISGRLRELGRLISCLRKNTKMKVSNLTDMSKTLMSFCVLLKNLLILMNYLIDLGKDLLH